MGERERGRERERERERAIRADCRNEQPMAKQYTVAATVKFLQACSWQEFQKNVDTCGHSSILIFLLQFDL